MKPVTINALIDISCLITFIPSLISGLVLYRVLPSLGINGSQWLIIHDYTSLAFAALLIIHLFLHWKLLRNIPGNLKPDAKKPDDRST